MVSRELLAGILDAFRRESIEYGLIGAFALYAHGYVRATRDIDFVTRGSNRARLKAYLVSIGFETIFDNPAFTNHLHPLGQVRVDIMYIEGKTADEVFSAVEEKVLFEGVAVKVVSPEHLIAMKLFAARNNPDRRLRELADIKELVARAGCDDGALREYLATYGFEDHYDEIRGEEPKGE
jgi:hypothetical protein